MAQYDPQRSRSRRRSGDDEGPAPVDALLGPSEPSGADPAAATPADDAPALIDLTDAAASTHRDLVAGNGVSAPDVDHGTPEVSSAMARVRPVLVALALVAACALAWAWLRRRREPPAPD